MSGPITYDSQVQRFNLNPEKMGEAIADIVKFLTEDQGPARPGPVGENRFLRVTAEERANGTLRSTDLATLILDSRPILIIHKTNGITIDPHELYKIGERYKV